MNDYIQNELDQNVMTNIQINISRIFRNQELTTKPHQSGELKPWDQRMREQGLRENRERRLRDMMNFDSESSGRLELRRGEINDILKIIE